MTRAESLEFLENFRKNIGHISVEQKKLFCDVYDCKPLNISTDSCFEFLLPGIKSSSDITLGKSEYDVNRKKDNYRYSAKSAEQYGDEVLCIATAA